MNAPWQQPPAQGPWGPQPTQQPGQAPAYQQPQQPQYAPQPGQAPAYAQPQPQVYQQQPMAAPQQYAPAPQQPNPAWGQPAAMPQYPQQAYGQQPAQPPGFNPFGEMNSGEQMRKAPFLGSMSKEGPNIEGDYILEVAEIKYKGKIRDGGNSQVIINVDIIESNQPLRPAGSSACVFIPQGMDMSDMNTTAFISAVFGVDPVTLPKNSVTTPWADPRDGRPRAWNQYAMEMIGTDNPWKGRRVGCSVVEMTLKKGGLFSRHDWLPAAQMKIVPRTFATQAAPSAMPSAAPGTPLTWGQVPPQFAAQPGAAPAGMQAPQYAPPGAPQQGFAPPPPPQQAQQPAPGSWNQPPQAPAPAQWNAPPGQAPMQQQPMQQQPAAPAQWNQPPGAPPGPWGQPPNR